MALTVTKVVACSKQSAVSEDQLDLHLPAPAVAGDAPLVPARMVNEFVYCPRLAYLMWTQSEWSETSDTIEGKRVHGRVDRPGPPLPAPDVLESDGGDKIITKSLTLSSAKLGVIAKLDLAEAENGVVTPVDYKRGRRPHVAQGAYEPERIQVCLQALLLEEHGFRVEEGVIYYAESRERVRVTLDDTLREAARRAVSGLRLTVAQGRIPPPLTDSPKCPRCALVTVCLPDELRSLAGSSIAPRAIAIPPDEALPLVVQSQNARIGKDGETLKIVDEERREARVRLIDISDVALFGNVSITTPALTALLEREIPITFHSHSGWFRGVAHGIGHRNVEVRTAQYRMSFDDAACLRFAKELVAAKIANHREKLRWKGKQRSIASPPRANLSIGPKQSPRFSESRGMPPRFTSVPSLNSSNRLTIGQAAVGWRRSASRRAIAGRQPTRSTPCFLSPTLCWHGT